MSQPEELRPYHCEFCLHETFDSMGHVCYLGDLKTRIQDLEAQVKEIEKRFFSSNKAISEMEAQHSSDQSSIKELVDYLKAWANFSNGEPEGKKINPKAPGTK